LPKAAALPTSESAVMAGAREQVGERLVKFKVFGQEYPLYTAAPEDEVEEILQLVKSQFDQMSKSSARLVSDKIAILTCLNMAGDLVRLRRDFEIYKQRNHENMELLAKKIETYLEVI